MAVRARMINTSRKFSSQILARESPAFEPRMGNPEVATVPATSFADQPDEDDWIRLVRL